MADAAVADDPKVDPAPAAPAEPKVADPPAEPVLPAEPNAAADPEPATDPPAAPAPPKAEPFDPAQVTLPEGGFVDESDRARIIAMATTHGWTTAQAQDALAQMDGLYDAQRAEYLDVTKKDATYGGEQLVKTQQLARSVIDFVRPDGHPRRDSFLAFFEKNGAGNHLEVLSFLADLGHAMAEDGGAVVGPKVPAPKEPANLAEALYSKPSKAAQ